MLHLTFELWTVYILALTGVYVQVSADTPANCSYEDIKGTWMFYLGSENNDRTVNCSNPFKSQKTLQIELSYPDVAIDEFKNIGHWTLIYNQGFEVVVAGRKYFGFSYYSKKESFCYEVQGGWSHDLLGRDWACYNGKKKMQGSDSQTSRSKPLFYQHVPVRFEVNSKDLVAHINNAQALWKASLYSHFKGYTSEDFIKIAGGRKSQMYNRPKPFPLTAEHKSIKNSLPISFDWRDVDGISYVSPVRNQGRCGSCYAFASMGMAEARVRIQTNNTQTPVFSTQDIVECSQYSQGCDGGFPYLVAGKYAEDFGLVLDKCNPYSGLGGVCRTDKSCSRHYFTDYGYIGGYYGGCNEVLMQQAIRDHGPIAISFMVYKDFTQYSSGVYKHMDGALGLDHFNPFVITNHVMVVVGWGQLPQEEGSTKYWIVKNSWGEEWGLSGYSHILRGVDECGIESIAVQSTPVYKYL